jgi:hypothetical protein
MATWSGPVHACPGPLCKGEADVAPHMLMCGRDWAALRRGAKPYAQAVWATWKNGAGAGSPAHTAAMQAAIRKARQLAEGRPGA